MIVGEVDGHRLIVPDNALQQSVWLARSLERSLGLDEIESSLASYWSLEEARRRWSSVLSQMRDPESLRLLDVGCGVGLFVTVGRLMGFDCSGIDSAEQEYQGTLEIARQLLRVNGVNEDAVRVGKAESIPFPDSSFDAVSAFQTIEHVVDPQLMLEEINRVLKPGGWVFLECPNYLYPYEVHYGVVVPCTLGKKATQLCLQLLHRRPVSFADHLNWVTPSKLRVWLEKACFGMIDTQSKNKRTALELPIDPSPCPFAFRRGPAGLLRPTLAMLHLPGIRSVARHFELYGQIRCTARKNSHE